MKRYSLAGISRKSFNAFAHGLMSYNLLTKLLRPKASFLCLAVSLLICSDYVSAQEPFLPDESYEAPKEKGGFLPDGAGGAVSFDDEFGDDEFDFEKTPDTLAEETRKEAFDAALEGLLPLRPEEIREVMERFDRTQESVELPVYPAPKPQVAVETLSMDPGTKPKVLKVAYGYVTTFNVVDTTGKPWPIRNITWAGNFDVYEVDKSELGYSNILRITPESEFAYGNMSISMVDLPTPIIISLETSRDIVHYRYDAIVPKRGPFAQMPLIESGMSLVAGEVNMANILEGAVPQSAVRMSVAGIDGRTTAYRFGGLTYLRTPLTLLSPGWISSTSSADGMHVYAMEHAPVLLLSNNGNMVRARLSDHEDIFDE